jgi:hypothetical protein
MLIYSNGCSHTAGHCVAPAKTWPNVVMRGILNNIDYETDPPKNKIKNINVLFNEAEFGSGNDYIFHKSLESISELIQKNKKPDYVFIQWTNPNRRVHQTINEENLFINVHYYPELGIKYEPMGSIHTLHYIFSMQEYLKKNNINYCFLNYMPIDKSIKKLNIYNQIDMDKFIFIEFDKNILFNGLIYHLKKNNMICDDAGHPDTKGNFLMGNALLKKFGFEELYYNKLC